MWLTPCDICGLETENIWVQEDGIGLCYGCADSLEPYDIQPKQQSFKKELFKYMTFDELRKDIEVRAQDYSRNSVSHQCFIEEASGFREGVEWTLLKLYQLGLLKIEPPNGE